MDINSNLSSSLYSALAGMSAAVSTVNKSAENILDATTLNSFEEPAENNYSQNSSFTPNYVSYANGVSNLQTNAAEADSMDLAQEIVNMKLAETTYKANIQTIKTVNEMSQKLLDTFS